MEFSTWLMAVTFLTVLATGVSLVKLKKWSPQVPPTFHEKYGPWKLVPNNVMRSMRGPEKKFLMWNSLASAAAAMSLAGSIISVLLFVLDDIPNAAKMLGVAALVGGALLLWIGIPIALAAVALVRYICALFF